MSRRYDERVSSDDETEDGTGSLLDDTGDETDITNYSDTDSLPENSDDDTDDEASLFEGEERHPPEHYLGREANLDVKRLRQKRYDDKTTNRLNWVNEHCIQ